jgi:hypothetical protein
MRVSLCGVLMASLLLVPVTASAGDRLKPWRVAAIVGCGVADALTTHYAIQRGAREANRLWKPIVDKPGVFIPTRIGVSVLIAWGNEKFPQPEGGKTFVAINAVMLHCGAAMMNHLAKR